MNKDINCECDCGECNVNISCKINNSDNNSCSSSSSDSSSTDSSESVRCESDSESFCDNKSSSECDTNKKNNKYRYIKHGKAALNVHAPKNMFLDSNYVCLYEILYKGILDYNLELQLKNVLESSTSSVYDSFYALVLTVFKLNPLPVDGLRLVVTEPDGTVVVDTALTTANTFSNWKTKSINENHNTRIAIIDAQTLEGGVGYETKHSTTLDLNQYYVAIRGGSRYKNFGTFRLSINVCTMLIE